MYKWICSNGRKGRREAGGKDGGISFQNLLSVTRKYDYNSWLSSAGRSDSDLPWSCFHFPSGSLHTYLLVTFSGFMSLKETIFFFYKAIIYIISKEQGKDGSVGKVACWQAWLPKFHPWDTGWKAWFLQVVLWPLHKCHGVQWCTNMHVYTQENFKM